MGAVAPKNKHEMYLIPCTVSGSHCTRKCLTFYWQCLDVIGGSADKSLARPTSRCRRTESMVSSERGVCSCAELQVFS